MRLTRASFGGDPNLKGRQNTLNKKKLFLTLQILNDWAEYKVI